MYLEFIKVTIYMWFYYVLLVKMQTNPANKFLSH